MSKKRLFAEDIDGTTNAVDTNISAYTVAASTETVISTLAVVNRSSNEATIRIAHIDGAVGDVADEDYIAYGIAVPANDTYFLTLGITMEATHTILVRSDIVDVNFVAWGDESSTS